jgi:hypothetical protein
MTLKHAHEAGTNFSISCLIARTGHFSWGQTRLAILCQSWRAGAAHALGRMIRVIVVHSESRILLRDSVHTVFSLCTDRLRGVPNIAKVFKQVASTNQRVKRDLYRSGAHTHCRCALPLDIEGDWHIISQHDGQSNGYVKGWPNHSWVRPYGGPSGDSFISNRMETPGTPRTC